MTIYRECLLRAKGQLSALLIDTNVVNMDEETKKASQATLDLLAASIQRAQKEITQS